MTIKQLLTATSVAGISLLGNAAYAASCQFFNDPLVINANCTEVYLYQSKSSVTIDSGATVSDSAPNGTTGQLAPGQLPAVAIVSLNSGTPVISSFINNGTITSFQATSWQNVGAVRPPAVSVGGSTTITSLINNGTITSLPIGANSPANTMEIWGTVGTFTNNGTVSATGNSNGVFVASGGSIGILNNNGTIAGSAANNGIKVDAAGSIATLNNAQAGLKYTGKLPSNYNTIITSPTAYGKLAVTAGSGQTTFGIASGSTFSNTATYTAVLTGVTAGNLANTTGTYGGGLVATNWRLNNSSGTQWDLSSASTTLTPNTGSNSGNKLGNAVVAAYSAGNVGKTLANGTNFIGAVQSLTVDQANALSNVHAEGYSSNQTINLEQMSHVTNTVMDRIHAPLSGNSATSTAFEVDQGRYMWVDATAMKGDVDSYNNLAGFSYRLSNLIMGGDIFRDASGGVGVFGGVGYTSMEEPQQVSQNFSTMNYYLGVYGGKYLPNSFKLSGAVGYVYSDTAALRNNVNVGHFTGGGAQSNYTSNGGYGALKLSRPFLVHERLTVTPFIGASYSQLAMGQTSERGSSDFNYTISSSTARSTLTFIGGEVLVPLSDSAKNPLSLIGFYRFGYDWSADKDSAHEITASSPLFGSFTQIGANKGPANNLMGLGLQGKIAQGVSIRAGIVGRVSTYGSEIGGGGEVKWEF
jgi:uncharacterized protein with beta-barrel porin domain